MEQLVSGENGRAYAQQRRLAFVCIWVMSSTGGAWLWPARAASAQGQAPVSGPGGFEQRVAGIHVYSEAGGAPLTMEDLARNAGEQGLDVIVPCDPDQAEVEFGLPFLRHIVRHRVVGPSIRTFGVDRYFKKIDAVQRTVPKVLAVPGAECTPHYFWEENYSLSALLPWRSGLGLRLRNAHRHLLVIGLRKPADYEQLPSIKTNYPIVSIIRPTTMFAYLVVIWLGYELRRVRRHKGVYYGGQGTRPLHRTRRMVGALLVLGGTALLINDVVWPRRLYDQYHGDQGLAPAQFFIDSVNQHGGLAFWSHPEVERDVKYRLIQAYTPAYYDALLHTHGYAGFGIFGDGMKHIGLPGGIWDRVLKEYCDGKRKQPVWAIGELDPLADLQSDNMSQIVTVLLLKPSTAQAAAAAGKPNRFTRDDVIDALRKGKMYAACNRAASRLRIEEFRVSTPDGGQVAYSGDTLESDVPGIGYLAIRALDNLEEMEFRVIRSHAPILTFEAPVVAAGQVFDYTFEVPLGEAAASEGRAMSFCRALGYERGAAVVATNPIFVRGKP